MRHTEDRNNYYGGACASLNLEDMWKHFNQEGAPPAALGRPRDWNIDLVPKFIMSQGAHLHLQRPRSEGENNTKCVSVCVVERASVSVYGATFQRVIWLCCELLMPSSEVKIFLVFIGIFSNK